MSVQATRLLVLGVIKLRGPIHGYGIERELNSWAADKWANITRPSIYNQLRTLERDGLIIPTSSESVATKLPKTSFSITDQGVQEYNRLLREILHDPEPFPLSLLPVLTFLPDLDKDEIIGAIKKRIAAINQVVDFFSPESLSPIYEKESFPAHTQEVFHLTRETLLGERRWARAFLKRIDSDAYPDLDSSSASASSEANIPR